MAASSSAASTSASISYPSHEVFINHRGCDVKNTFASLLYHRLRFQGLQVFLDREELLEGHGITPQIEEAIRGASVQVAIFSPRYGQSYWCLNELVLMVDSMVASRTTIIPVFYQVDPSVVRWTTGPYREALEELEQKRKKTRDPQTGEYELRYDADTIKGWKNALYVAANISGFELRGDLGELLEEVVQRVFKVVHKTPLQVARYPTGLPNKLEDFKRTVFLEQDEVKTVGVKVVGIVGVGGVGKTTLAKHFFNEKRSEYDASSFLFEVRENARQKSLAYLQRKLLQELGLGNIEFSSHYEGIEILKKHLSSRRVLIVLDDVDHLNQLEAFLLIKDNLDPDSLILLTSRDKQILKRFGFRDSPIYNLKGLDRPDSKELFCCHAFHQSHPLPEFEDLVDEFVRVCDGLPLSLKVFGSLVCDHQASFWKEKLARLDNIGESLPDEIDGRLSISYESLDRDDQKLFLDIVFFFIGEKVDMVGRIWESEAVLNLESKCLLEVDSQNKIKMHDHIRDMGRGIAKGGSMPLRLSEMRHLSQVDEFLERSSSGIAEIRGISIVQLPKYRQRSKYNPDKVWRSEMSRIKRWMHEVLGNSEWKLFNNNRYYGTNLEILAIEDGYLKAILRKVRSPQPRWLCWYKCPCSCLPSWVPMNKLRVLQVFGSGLKMLWQSETQAPLDLRELHIIAPLSHFPKSIGQLRDLEKIVVHCYPAGGSAARRSLPLESLPEEFCDLRSLKYLELRRCMIMMSLPESFGKLTSLQHLDLEGANSLQSLPESFGKLTSLQHLDLEGADSLQSLPNSFGKLTQLKHLNLRFCRSLKMSSETLVSITTLEYLNLFECQNVNDSLFSQAARQPSLKTLLLEGTDLKQFPRAIGDLANLEVLRLGGNISGMSNMMEEFPPLLHCLGNLRELSITYCSELKSLPDAFGLLTQLEDLSVVGCPNLKCLPAALGQLTQLKKLGLRNCGIEHLPENLLSLNNLQDLNVYWCPLRDVPFKKVESEREGGGALKKLDSKEKCMFGLRDLSLCNVKISEVAFPEGVCPNLRCLHLENCEQLREMEICGLANLRTLRIWRCANLEELPSLETLVSLEHIEVESCPKVKSIQGLAQLTKLSALRVEYCDELRELPGVERVKSLKALDVQDCSKLQWDDAVLEQLRPIMKELNPGRIRPFRNCIGSQFLFRCCRRF